MTPKEKALDILEKIISAYHGSEERHVSITNHKRAAIIAVDEILSLDVWGDYHNTPEGTQYWESVKEELNKL